MQETVSKDPGEEAELNYRPSQQDGYASGDATSVGVAEDYGIMSGYYPYYITSGDVNSPALWSLGDATVSPGAVSYGYHQMDYASMMTNYGYPGFGWFAGSGWEPGLGDVKNDPSASYATNGGYYDTDTSSIYNSTATTSQEGDTDITSVNHRMKIMTLQEVQHANDHTVDGMETSTDFHNDSKSWAAVVTHPPHSYSGMLRSSALQQMPWMPGSMWDGRYAGNVGRQTRDTWPSRRRPANSFPHNMGAGGGMPTANSVDSVSSAAANTHLNQYNPKEFDLNPKSARFFIIKSYAEDDIHRSIKYGIWCSTEYGNKRLDVAYREREGKGPVFLFFSVNGSGHFCGIAQMTSPVDYETSAEVWQQGKKWKGQFTVKWIYVKDVPNSQLRHIKLENNEGKPVTNSRDTQEVPPEKGCQVLRVIHQYRQTTSIFDDFSHYENSQHKKDDNTD